MKLPLALFTQRTLSSRLMFLLMLSASLSGCFQRFYSVKTVQDYGPETFTGYQVNNKYFILHSGDSAYELSFTSADTAALHGTLYPLPAYRRTFEHTNPVKPNRYQKSGKIDERFILEEVHIYSDLPVRVGAKTVIPLKNIYHIDEFVHDKAATGASTLLGVLGVGLPLTAVLVAGIATSNISEPTPTESCPFIYLETDTGFRFIGEIYSGAIYPSLERDDYLTMAGHSSGKEMVTLKMTNELQEVQYTNLTELMVFDHPRNVQVLVDKYGNVQTLSDLHTPDRAASLDGLDVKAVLSEMYDQVYSGVDINSTQPLTDGVELTFSRPAGSAKAKLVIHAVNTPWLDVVVNNFHQLFGTEFQCWIKKQETIPPKIMKNWVLNQKIPLSVYILKNGQWKFSDYFNIVGPMAAKQDVLSLDLKGVDGDSVRIKLEYGNKFWALDYAAIDYSENVPVKQWVVSLSDAKDKAGNDVRLELTKADNNYYVQRDSGDEAVLTFRIPPEPAGEQTLVLHSRGYYLSKIDPQGEEQRDYLLAFRKKSRMPAFSNELIYFSKSHASSE